MTWRRLAGSIRAFFFVFAALAGAVPALAGNSATLIMYHRFGESAYPSTNTTIEQFEAHIAELKRDKYSVLPVREIVAALREGRELPKRTVGVTIDDAYLSVYITAWPMLREAGIPFTLFAATDPLDHGGADYMDWGALRELAAAGVEIGSQTASHLHMAEASEDKIRKDLNKSGERFQAELGRRPALFAYPYGEASGAVEDLVKEEGFEAAFGQHSGAFDGTANFFFLPRFALNEHYGDIARLRLAANAMALPVSDMVPPDHLITGNNPPSLGFTVAESVRGLDRLACYASHVAGESVRIERLGARRVEVRVEQPFPKGRTRLNCTLPVGDGRWRWLGRQFVVPR